MQKLHEQGVPLFTKAHNKYAGVREFLTQYGTTRERDKYYGKNAINKNLIYYGGMGLVGMFSLSVAIASSYDTIYLLGYDFGTTNITNNFTHFYQNDLKVFSTGVNHPEVYRNASNKVKREVEDFSVYLAEKDVKIWNVSPESNIYQFDKIAYETFFEDIKRG